LTPWHFLIFLVVDVPGESSIPLSEALHDTFVSIHYSGYLSSVMKAKDEGVKVGGYFAWSLMVQSPSVLSICDCWLMLK